MITSVKNCVNYGAVLLEEKILNSITDAQKRVALIAAGVFTLIAAIYLMIKFYPKIVDRQAKKLDETDANLQKKNDYNFELNQRVFPKEPPSKIPSIGGYGFIDRERRMCEELFTMLYDKKFLDPVKDKDIEKVIDDFAAFIQHAPYDRKISVNIVENKLSQEAPKEALDKGCHFHVYIQNSGWGGEKRRELAMTHKFLRTFNDCVRNDDKKELKAMLLQVVDELKEVFRLEEEQKKEVLRLEEKWRKEAVEREEKQKLEEK